MVVNRSTFEIISVMHKILSEYKFSEDKVLVGYIPKLDPFFWKKKITTYI